MLSQMPLPPSGNVNDAYFYVEAPWIKDLSKYNMNVDGSMYMDIDKYNGKYVFFMGRVGAYNSYIKFDNDVIGVNSVVLSPYNSASAKSQCTPESYRYVRVPFETPLVTPNKTLDSYC